MSDEQPSPESGAQVLRDSLGEIRQSLDALADSVCGGQVNDVDIPYTLVIRGYDRMQEPARRFVDRVCRILLELRAEGCDIDVRCE